MESDQDWQELSQMLHSHLVSLERSKEKFKIFCKTGRDENCMMCFKITYQEMINLIH